MTPAGDASGPPELAHEFVSWLGELAASVSAVDAALFAVALAIVLVLRASLRATARVGPVEVETLDCDPSAGTDVQALSAFLREQVADSGLPPPPLLPAGAPRVTALAAAAASPLPQASFIAKALEALPLPQASQYKLSGTLSKNATAERVSYWLRSSDHGGSVMATVEKAKYEQAIEEAAFEVYSHVSTRADRAFPPWARWRSAAALRAYRAGCDAADRRNWNTAIASLRAANRREPANALIRLQLANVYERRASSMRYTAMKRAAMQPPALKSVPPEVQAKELARALVAYCEAARDCRWLTQAHYRASVLAGTLADMCTEPAAIAEARRGIVACLELTGQTTAKAEQAASAPALAKEIRDWADSQSHTLLVLLRPWYVLLTEGRARTQFEPSAVERRQLKRSVRISRKSMQVRSVGDARGRAAWCKLRYAQASARLLLFFGLMTLDWQTHYVAACFYALLLERAQDLHERPDRQRRLMQRAFSHLQYAVEHGGSALPVEWVNQQDPDLGVLRDSPDWTNIERYLRGMSQSVS
jgi:hypothetical protein